jgi:uncharacterized protein (DUF2235 family)
MDAGPEERAKKRLVICCDGTWNAPDSRHITNVEKIARTVEIDLRRTGGVQQMVLYVSGVGAGSYQVDRILGGAFGFGLFANIRSAYRFLALNYDEGDDIFVVGFSRGAYTARSLVGMIGRIGLLTRDALVADKLGEAEARYRAGPEGASTFALSPDEFRHRFCHTTSPITLLGVFDTVGALGVPGAVRNRRQFHDVNLSSVVQCARQALALDERRLKFEPSLWEAADEQRRADESSGRVEQVWFPGVHSDVGGGYARSGLSDTALLWMVQEARAKGLVFDERLLEVYLGSGKPAVVNDSLTRVYKVLNVLSQTRMTATRTGRRFTHGWRRPDPPPDPRKPEHAVGVRISSTAVARFVGDPAYHHPNLAEFSRAPGFGDHEETVEPLPRT